MNPIRHDSPSFHRNIEPLTQKLHEVFTPSMRNVLEIGSGSGQHIARFAAEFPQVIFQPTEYDQDNLASINSWCKEHDTVSPALQLDVTRENWFTKRVPKFDALLCFNVIHITPWEVTKSIFNGANTYMADECRLIFYGPFKVDGQQTSESNGEFEKWLKEKDVSYGIRDISDMETEAEKHGFKLNQSHPMPANNFLNIFSRV